MHDHATKRAHYFFGSAFATIVIGVLVFLTALSWNSAIQETIETYSPADELKAKFSYAYLISSIAIVVSFLFMYYIDCEKW